MKAAAGTVAMAVAMAVAMVIVAMVVRTARSPKLGPGVHVGGPWMA